MKRLPSLVGQQFGYLIVIQQVESTASGQRRWLCRCRCGKETVTSTYALTHGRTSSCGCKKENDLTGKRIGSLTVLERSDCFGPRGARRSRLWKCLCDCGEITYKATDTLTNKHTSMCQTCAEKYCVAKAQENAGFVDGTQLSKIRQPSRESGNLSGIRGVYLDQKTGRYRARIKFKGVSYYLGTYNSISDAIDARKAGEEKYFGKFLNEQYPDNA